MTQQKFPIKYVYTFIVLIFFLSACGAFNKKPEITRVTEQGKVLGGDGNSDYTDTVFLDAREPIQSRLWSLPQARKLWWRDFIWSNNSSENESIQKRLALMGLEPNGDIIILGAGLSGNGEEGYWAYLLESLGFKNIRVMEALDFRSANMSAEVKEPQSKPYWNQTFNNERWLNSEGFLNQPQGLVIDVRSERKYLEGSKTDPEIGAINIPWSYFYEAYRGSDADQENFISKLKGLGIEPERNLTVIDEGDHATSYLVGYILNKFGYNKVAVLKGGYQSLRANSKRPSF